MWTAAKHFWTNNYTTAHWANTEYSRQWLCGKTVAGGCEPFVVPEGYKHCKRCEAILKAQEAQQSNPTCPDCGATMKPQGRGATARKHGLRWVCPVAEAEVTKDERGHLHRCADAKHPYTRVWSDDELQFRA